MYQVVQNLSYINTEVFRKGKVGRKCLTYTIQDFLDNVIKTSITNFL